MVTRRIAETVHVACLVLVLVLAAALTACSRKDQSTAQLVVGLAAEPERFDPLTMKNPQNFIASWQIYEGLFGLDDRGEIVPALADRWETADNKTWRIHVRQGVSFHRSELFGAPASTRQVTAADVVASYTAFCSAAAYPAFLLTDSVRGCAEFNGGKATAVDGLRAVDESTVEIELNKPEPFFLNRLTTAWIAIFPREQLDTRYDATRGISVAVGTGPFRLSSRTSSEIVLERNTDYWDKAASGTLSKLVYRVLSNDQIRLAELRKGGIDLLLVPPSAYPSVLDSAGSVLPDFTKNLRAHTYATLNSHMIGINNARVADVHLRRAMNHAVNRAELVKTLLYGQADATVGTIPPGTRGYKPPFDVAATFDLGKARDELAKSSYKGEPIDLLVHDQAGSEQIGQLFQAQMKAIGINISLTKVDFNSAIGRMVKGDTQLFGMFFDYVFSSPEPILMTVFPSTKRPAPNFWQFADSAIDEEIESLRSLPADQGLAKSAVIEQRVMDQVPALFLFRLRQMVLYSDRFDGLSVNPHGHFRFDRVRAAASN